MTRLVVAPEQVVAPPPDVADRTLVFIDALAETRRSGGSDAMQTEATAMHDAALAMLRGEVGAAGVRRVLDIAGRENDRIEARDAAVRAERAACRTRQKALAR